MRQHRKRHPRFRVRMAVDADALKIIAIVNAAFAVETFLEGARTDELRMAESMKRGKFLVAEDPDGKIVASAYTEIRGNRGYLACWPSILLTKGKAWAAS